MLFSIDSRWRHRWDLIVYIAIIFGAFLTPFEISFDQSADRSSTNFGFIIGMIFSTIFVIDIFVNLNTTYIDEISKIVIVNRRKITKRYAKSIWFIVDLICALPIDLLCYETSFEAAVPNIIYLIVTVIRIFKLTKFSERKRNIIEDSFGVKVNPFLYSFVSTMLKVILIIHLIACGWYYIAVPHSFYEVNSISWV